MSWTALDLTQNANNLNWGTTNMGSIVDVSNNSLEVQRLSPSLLTEALNYVLLQDLIHVAGGIDGYLPTPIRPIQGDLEVVGGQSQRPSTGMIYPRRVK